MPPCCLTFHEDRLCLSVFKAQSELSLNVREREAGREQKEGEKEGRGERKEGGRRRKEGSSGTSATCRKKLSPPLWYLSKQLAELRQFCLKIISQGISIPFHT